MEINTLINIQIDNIEMDRYKVRDYTKANKWKYLAIDLNIIITPLRAKNVTK